MSTCPQCGTRLREVDGVCPCCVARSLTTQLRHKPPHSQEHLDDVPGYTLHELLGQGGMGRVFRAERVEDGTQVAIKLLPEHLADDDATMDRFAREAQTLSALNHKHILRVIDSGVSSQGRLYLVTELASGGDLACKMASNPLGKEEALRLFHQVLDAVQAAHEKGIVHRDIKPANVLLSESGEVRVGDFSLAKIMPQGSAAWLTQTQSADIFGTPYYIAPELRGGTGQVSPKADIFALGVLLHEMLTQRVPIGNYEPASSIAAVPKAVDAVIAECLREDPGKRPADVAALRQCLTQATQQRPRWPGLLALTTCLILTAVWILKPEAPVSKENPWVNSLGMHFIPVAGTEVWFSIWETRRSDYGAFAEKVPIAQGQQELWRRPIGKVTQDHPVTPLSMERSIIFCDWLTEKEQREGLLPKTAHYRLPTTQEWEAMAKQGKDLAGEAAGNVAGLEVGMKTAFTHKDAWRFTAPVGTFPPTEHGLYDVLGNAAEWCTDTTTQQGILRGGSWSSATPEAVRWQYVEHHPRQAPVLGAGFRVVLEGMP